MPMFRHPLSSERLAELVRRTAGISREKQREALAGARLASTRVRIQREAAPSPEVLEKIRAVLGGDIVGRVVPFVISTPERAEDGHTLDPAGCDSAEYERAPHVFWSHEYSGWRATPSRAAVRIGASVVTKTAESVTAMCGFYTRDFSQALDGGFSFALGEIAARQGHRASVGFDIVEASVASEEVRITIPWALDISAWRLNEWSLVNFGADANAITAGRADGIDVEPIARALERFLDDVALSTGVARDALARMWASAADPGRPKVVAPPTTPAPFDAAAFRLALRDGIASALS